MRTQAGEVSALLHIFDMRERQLLAQEQRLQLPFCIWCHLPAQGLCSSLETAIGCESQTVPSFRVQTGR